MLMLFLGFYSIAGHMRSFAIVLVYLVVAYLLFNSSGNSISLSDTSLAFAPFLSVGSSDAEASDEVEADDNVVLNSPRTYIVNSLFTKQLIGIYSTQRDLLAASDILLGEALTHRRLINIIGNGGIIHTVKGSFIISVTGPSS